MHCWGANESGQTDLPREYHGMNYEEVNEEVDLEAIEQGVVQPQDEEEEEEGIESKDDSDITNININMNMKREHTKNENYNYNLSVSKKPMNNLKPTNNPHPDDDISNLK